METPSKILLAGHGYLGAPLASSLVDRGHSVFAFTKTFDDVVPDTYPLISCDLGEPEALGKIEFDPDIIIHCASSNRGGPDAYRTVFEGGIENLHAAFPEAHLFFTSSTSVYGQTDGAEVDETSLAEPETETSEILRRAEDRLVELNGTVLRLAGIYGPHRSVYLKRFFEGTATIETGESRYLNQIHLADIIGAIQHLLQGDIRDSAKGEIFNVADDTPLTQRECFEGLAAMFGKPVPPEAEPNKQRKRAWTNKRVTARKLKTTGWEARYPSFFEAVKRDESLVPSIMAQIE